MALLKLSNIGKIYVTGGTVAVGIRGVNLSFERGEFVAITGKSGSGKSTLLNVISGMDSYEEGEMFIDGQSTSHYIQKDWEEYREKYISFIFQDYNIIESYTVLENVELSLMHIENPKERRKRAVELLTRVGMKPFLKHRGSKLSGGQKQRTVIARALAKDSPIILADEPTGNLDSATSAEIIDLLHEVSKDKLLIMVTHNFEQVEKIATRHIRIFDGALESDHVLIPTEPPKEQASLSSSNTEKPGISREIRNGFTLGLTIFKSKPKLSFFMCLLLIIGTLGTFLVTSSCGDAASLFDENYMFAHINGRLVIVKQDGSVIAEEELQKLCEETGAKSYIHYDRLLDILYGNSYYYRDTEQSVELKCTFGKDYGNPDIGRYPEKDNEALLHIPISYQKTFGKDTLKNDYTEVYGIAVKVVGIKYYYDNTIEPEALMTEEGFRTVNAYYTAQYNGSTNLEVTLTDINVGMAHTFYFDWYSIFASDEIEDGKICILDQEYNSYLSKNDKYSQTLRFTAKFYSYDYGDSIGQNFEYMIDPSCLTSECPELPNGYFSSHASPSVVISTSLYRTIIEDYLSRSYRQASLFYENDKDAHNAVQTLKNAGYIAIPSDTTCEPDLIDTIGNTLVALMSAFIWVISILFLAFFINLCTSRAIGAFKGEMAIMRSMGIHVTVIKIGMYVRMLISLIPAYILVICTAICIFTSPKINEMFTYMQPWQYVLIFLGMLIIVTRITHKQIQKLFNESVKKSLKGGAAQ